MRKFILAALMAVLALPAMAQAPHAPAAHAPAAVPAKPAVPAPAAAPAAAAASPAAGARKVDINAGTAQQLDALPGIGAARAKAIIAGRPYDDLTDLVRKKVLSQSVFDGARSGMALANINSAPAALLEHTLPGIGDVRSKAIVAGRPYAAPQDLVTRGVLTQAQFDRIKDLIVS